MRWGGIEPPRLAPHGPQPCLSASSSTSAYMNYYMLSPILVKIISFFRYKTDSIDGLLFLHLPILLCRTSNGVVPLLSDAHGDRHTRVGFAAHGISERPGSERNRLRLNRIQSRSYAPHMLREEKWIPCYNSCIHSGHSDAAEVLNRSRKG